MGNLTYFKEIPMYQVIARKYRPQNFDTVVGQEAVVTTLRNAIASHRLHHAYLFAGARGIGKTSLARIFAKAINCEKGPTIQPCNECSQCKEITQGTSLDVQEIDGASNNSVEEVREIRERLKFLPVSAKNKIYIIDEVHMLSTAAFNALLKTLEEPPPNVIFLFATTEVHKIPATILSRCQRFDLRRIPSEPLLETLRSICELEKAIPNPDSLLLIARESGGSMRDAQSLLDQAIAFTGAKLGFEEVSSMLGLSNTQDILEITEAVLKGETSRALTCAQAIYEKGHDIKQLSAQWLNHWRNLLIFASTQSSEFLKDLTEYEKSSVKVQSAFTDLPAFDLGFHLLHRATEEIARSEFPKILLDVLVVRLSNLREMEKMSEVIEEIRGKSPALANSAPAQAAPRIISSSSASPSTSSSLKAAAKPAIDASLVNFIQHVSSKRPQIASLLNHLSNSGLVADKVFLQFEKGGIWMEILAEKKELLETMAKEFFGKKMQVLIQDSPLPDLPGMEQRKNTPRENPTVSPIVDSAIQILNAKIEEVDS